jgi:hypothetical protein
MSAITAISYAPSCVVSGHDARPVQTHADVLLP